MNIRVATVADVAGIVALETQTDFAAHWTSEQWARVFDAAPARMVLLLEEPVSASAGSAERQRFTAVIGFVVGLCAGPEWEIENVAVASGARERGCGTLLVKELIARACAAGAESIFLEVREGNIAAIALYERCGFVCTGRRRAYYSDLPEDALVYQFRLR